MAKLHQDLQDRLITCDLDDIPGFPACIVEAKLYDLDQHFRDEINTIYDDLDARLRDPHRSEMVEIMHARERVELFKVPLMHQLIPDLIEEGKSVVVFVNFRQTCLRLHEWASQTFDGASIVIGDQPQEVRDHNVQQFQHNRTHVMIAMSQAGGVGISLHDLHHERPRISLIFPGWSAVHTKQCLGRIHRAGGTPAIQRFCLAAGTVEERVYRAIQNKLINIEALNDGDLV